MKTSNKLLLGLAAFVSCYILAAFTEVKIKGWYKGERQRVDYVSGLPDFQFLKVDNLIDPRENITVIISDRSAFVFKVFEGDDIPKINYHMNEDTLVIDQIGRLGRTKLNINASSQSLKGIIARNRSIVKLKGNIDDLMVDVKDSRFTWFTPNTAYILKKVKVVSDERSNVYILHDKIMDLEVDLSQSHLGVNKVDNLTGSIKNSAYLAINKIENKDLIIDQTSRVSSNHRIGHY